MTIKIGDKVRLTKSISVNHFRGANMSIVGIVIKINDNNFVGFDRRPYFIKFDDREGEWAYARDEIKKV